jgi:dTDP-4-amino-4,6-dideoxygalactose transaminase
VTDIDFPAIGHTRGSFMRALQAKNIITQVHYIPVVMHPYYAGLGWSIDQYPEAEAFYQRALSLPLYFSLEDAELAFVMREIERLCLHD